MRFQTAIKFYTSTHQIDKNNLTMVGQYHQYLSCLKEMSGILIPQYMCFSDYDCDVHNSGWYDVCIMQLLYVSNNMQETNHLICCLDKQKLLFFLVSLHC